MASNLPYSIQWILLRSRETLSGKLVGLQPKGRERRGPIAVRQGSCLRPWPFQLDFKPLLSRGSLNGFFGEFRSGGYHRIH